VFMLWIIEEIKKKTDEDLNSYEAWKQYRIA
jgi:hypothetical protein